MKIIKNDPFVTINEIKNEIMLVDESFDIGWWKVFSILKKHKLLRRKSRFRYVRKYY